MVDWKSLGERLEVPKEVEDDYYENDGMTNRDLIPIPEKRRTWTAIGYFSYWIVEGVSVSGYTGISSLVGVGLTVKQSIGCAVGAGFVYGMMSVIMGWIGAHHHIGFPVFSRATFGVKGYYFPIVIRVITGTIWQGVQSYYGGLAIAQCITAMNPKFANWNTFSETSGNITSANFVGLVLYIVFILPCILIPPERLQNFFRVTFVMVFFSIIGMLIYSMKENNGPGTMFNQNSSELATTGDVAWAAIRGMFSIIGTCGTGILGQSDWTRFAKHKRLPVLAQTFGAPIALTFAGTMGALITSASNDLFGEPIWNPIQFLGALQKRENNSSKARAGVFFASAGFVGQQLAINLLLNTLSSGMDLAGVFPRFLNLRRASYIIVAVSICCCPWYLQSSAKVVIIFGLGWGCFCSSLTGIVLAKYYFIYKRKVLLSHLYLPTSESIYWFWNGVDWRSCVAWCFGTGFLMPGLAAAANSKEWGFWSWIFNVSYAWGIVISSLTLIGLHFIFPKYDIIVDHSLDEIYTPCGDLIADIDNSELSSGAEVIDETLKGCQTISTKIFSN